MNFIRPILLTAALAGLISTPALADGALRGRVTDRQGHPLPGAVIRVHGPQGNRGAEADNQGWYHFYGLPPDRYEVQVTMDGYSTDLKQALIRNGMTHPVPFQLGESNCYPNSHTPDLFVDPYSSGASIHLTREELEPFALGRTLGDWVDAVGP